MVLGEEEEVRWCWERKCGFSRKLSRCHHLSVPGMDVAVVLVGNGPRQDDLDGGEVVQAFT